MPFAMTAMSILNGQCKNLEHQLIMRKCHHEKIKRHDVKRQHVMTFWVPYHEHPFIYFWCLITTQENISNIHVADDRSDYVV